VVRSVLECEASERVIGALRESAAGREFLADLDAYLSRYGMRSDMWGLGAPSWIEDPTPVIRNLRDYIGRPDGDAPAVRTRRAAEGRERAIAEARERLAVYPAMVVEQFEALLEAAQIATVLSEDHGFWIDCAGTYRERMVILEAGRRLAEAGVLGDAGDVFHLSPAEVRASLVAGRTRDRRALVAQRIDEIARRRALDPPAVLGSMPPGPPPESPFSRAMMKFIGMPAGPSETPGELTGSAGSKGTVRGPARIIRSISEADRVRPGDVLVAETTAPPWTPLFATVAAVVTDTGGVLSHCAVVAREYGIPAVVGVGVATQAIADGQLIEVDGDAGVVRIIGD
jgi:pyruvate,water dikinase